MKTTRDYVFFWTAKDFLSQWYPAEFKWKGFTFPTSEHWMMFEKARLFKYQTNSTKFLHSCLEEEIKLLEQGNPVKDGIAYLLSDTSPKHAKAYGRTIPNFDTVVWENHVEDIIFRGNVQKFTQNKHLLKRLLETGDKVLVEASPFDKIYGIGLRQDDPRALDPTKWEGENKLGKVLTKVRDSLK